jgi:uncharacterized membrane protein YccC
MTTAEQEASAVRLGLRVAVTASACLVISEWLQLSQRSLSVYTAHMAMVLFPYSALQKALERLAGRIIGVLYGLVVFLLLGQTSLLLVFLMLVGQLIFFYVNASGHLAYGSLMAGLFLGVIVEQGLVAPGKASAYAVALAEQLVLATIMIFLVNWVTGAERTLTIVTKGEALWPLRRDWLNKSCMVSTAQTGSMFAAMWLDLPALPTMISASIIALSSLTHRAMGQKAYLRTVGAVLAGGYAFVAMLLLAFQPYFTLLVGLVFFGMFLAAYFTKASSAYSYAFMQMGLAMPMVLVSDTNEIGSMKTAIQRLIGVGAGLAVAELVYLVWPQVPQRK